MGVRAKAGTSEDLLRRKRLLGSSVELLSPEAGWPDARAPFESCVHMPRSGASSTRGSGALCGPTKGGRLEITGELRGDDFRASQLADIRCV